MAISLTPKRIHGHTYWYARKCQRVDGKPKIVWQKYLGRAEKIVEAIEGLGNPPEPQECLVFEFGAVAALHSMAEKLGLVAVINQHVGKRDQGLSVGHYLLIAAISRAICSRSKRATGRWFSNTVLSAIYPQIQAKHLTSQRFWDHMDRVPLPAIPKIEADITRRILDLFEVDLRCLLYDTTNYFTFIDSFNERCEIPQRGKDKQKRTDLRQVSLALMVTLDHHIPLFHKAYEGNRNDVSCFKSVVDTLVERLNALRQGCEEITLVFDAGNNSKENLAKIDRSDYHFIGSLVRTQHWDLLEIDRELFQPVEGHEGLSAYRTKKKVFGRERTIVITFNETLYDQQTKTLDREISKARKALQERQRRLRNYAHSDRRAGFEPTEASVSREVNRILARRHMKKLFHVDIEIENGIPLLRYRFDKEAHELMTGKLFGKMILFTDNHAWSTREIVEGYHNLYVVEDAIRQTKTPAFVNWSPMYHWTDQKIAVHAFYCVLALSLVSLLHRECERNGLKISIDQMMEELEGIREVALIYPAKGKGAKAPRPVLTLSRLNPTQRRLVKIFELGKYRGRYYASLCRNTE